MRRRQFREMVDKIGEGHRLHREELRAHREENDRQVPREILLEQREAREMLRGMRHGIQANTEGLLRVLDEFRRGDGPAAAGT